MNFSTGSLTERKKNKVQITDATDNDLQLLKKNIMFEHLSRKYTYGLGLLLIVVVIWTISSYVVQDILSGHGERAFFLTYFANSLFLLQLPFVLCYRYYNNLDPYPDKNSDEYTELNTTATATIAARNNKPRASCRDYIKGMYHWETLRAAIIVMPLWFMANGLYNLSLAHTSVTSNTVISSTSGMFTYAIAVRSGQEGFSWYKIVGVLCSISGTTLTAVADTTKTASISNISSLSPSSSSSFLSPSSSSSSSTSSVSNSLIGDLICLCAAFFYGLYTTAIHRHLPSINKTNLFFGYLGALGFITCTPIVLILNWTNVEDLSLISSRALLLMVVKGLFDNVLSDTLWAIAMKWTSPTVATLGLALTIPCSIFGAMLMGLGFPSFLAACGALVMLVGFGLVNVEKSKTVVTMTGGNIVDNDNANDNVVGSKDVADIEVNCVDEL